MAFEEQENLIEFERQQNLLVSLEKCDAESKYSFNPTRKTTVVYSEDHIQRETVHLVSGIFTSRTGKFTDN
jgi:hypothetical protein